MRAPLLAPVVAAMIVVATPATVTPSSSPHWDLAERGRVLGDLFGASARHEIAAALNLRREHQVRTADAVARTAEAAGLGSGFVSLALAVTDVESRFNPTAVGPTTRWGRACGPMQVLVGTAQSIAPGTTCRDLRSIDHGVRVGVAYLARGYRERGGDRLATAQRYFAGPNPRMCGRRCFAYRAAVASRLARLGDRASILADRPMSTVRRLAVARNRAQSATAVVADTRNPHGSGSH